ncbi:MAG TPA: hypothetical protein VGX26_09590, partial [Solirubrobacteraceae bacterium]|nr:hypothetical protein [Solirubrobacteraceae bacterium]
QGFARRMTMRVDDPGQLSGLFADRANAGDLEGMLALYEQDATFVGPDGTWQIPDADHASGV